MTETENDAETRIAEVEKEYGISKQDQLEAFKALMDVEGKGIEMIRTMYGRAIDLRIEMERVKVRLAEVEQEDRASRRDFELAKRNLDLLERTLAAHFAERQESIRNGFKIIDRALEDKQWDMVVKVFSDMSNMVAQSPLAAAVELKNKIRSGKAITLDDF
jgi:hypothetical protein